jgi:hypothetical protein
VVFKGEINHRNVKMRWGHLKIFCRTTLPILSRLGTNHPGEGGFKFVQTKGIALSKGR